jgi:hypothetical protein
VDRFKKLREDWEVAKAALMAQRELAERDPGFPDALMGREARRKFLARLNKLISEYEGLLREFGNAPRP